MKKITMICMAAMLLLAASCKKEKEEINEPAGEVSVFSVETEVHSGDSKTHLEGARVIWDSNDAINVINGNNVSKEFTFSKYVDGGDGSVAEFKAENLPADFYKPNYTGYYPSNFNPSSYSMLQTQTYSANGFVAGSNPMIATNEAKKLLHFKNVLGILELQLKSVDNSMTVKEIRVRSNDINEKLWGNGSVVNGEFKVSSGGSNTVKLNCGSVTINSTTPTSFFILLPPGTLTGGFEVDVVDTDGEFWIMKTVNSNEIVRSRIKRMPAVSVKTCTSEDVQLWYNAPYWATKNLGASNSVAFGNFYAWGETSPKTTYNWASYSRNFVTGTYSGATPNGKKVFKKYSNNSPNYTDPNFLNTNDAKKTVLDATDDAALVSTSGEWRMPTYDEFKTLLSQTTHSAIITYKGVRGVKLTGKDSYDDRFIFFPAAGYYSGSSHGGYNNPTGWYEGNYWTTKLNTIEGTDLGPFQGEHFYFDSDGEFAVEGCQLARYYGCSIRPIKVNN